MAPWVSTTKSFTVNALSYFKKFRQDIQQLICLLERDGRTSAWCIYEQDQNIMPLATAVTCTQAKPITGILCYKNSALHECRWGSEAEERGSVICHTVVKLFSVPCNYTQSCWRQVILILLKFSALKIKENTGYNIYFFILWEVTPFVTKRS